MSPTPDPRRANRCLARRWLDLVSAHDVEALCALTAPGWCMHGGPPGLPAGPAGVRALFATFGPVEQRWTVDDVVAERDRVALRATNRCLQESFLGVPTHARWQTFTATFVLRVAGGLVHETWRNAADLGRLLQLGARVVAGAAAGGAPERAAPTPVPHGASRRLTAP